VSLREYRNDICYISPGWSTAFLLAGNGDRKSPGGAEVQVTRVGAALAGRGVRVAYVVLDLAGAPQQPAPGLPVTMFRAYRPGKGRPVLRYFVHTVPKLWRALRRANARVYYFKGAGGMAGIAALFCRTSGAKLVLAVANDHDLDPNPPLKKLSERLLFKFARRRADAIVVQTQSQAARLARLGLRGIMIPSACELPAGAGVEPNGGTVLWAGRAREVKRPGLLVELARRLPEVKFTFALVKMRRDEALYEEVRAQAASLPNIEFVGAVPYAQMAALYERTCLLVNTSESEGFPNTFLEAWARGIPVVASVDPDGLLSARGLGLHCESVAEMAEAVRRLWQDAALRDAMGRRGREYVVAHHSLEAVAEQYLRLFGRLGMRSAGEAAARAACAGAEE